MFSVLHASGLLHAQNPADRDLRQLILTSRTNLSAALIQSDRLVLDYPSNVTVLRLRARVHEQLRQYPQGVRDLTEAIRLDGNSPDLWQGRGELNFKAGRFKESVQDFDRVIEMAPQQAPHHWQRGISLYYAHRYTEGRQQFENHKSVNPNDVENAAWHFLCAAKETSVTNARALMVTSGPDGRVPMREVDLLYRGRGTVEEVLKAAREVKGQRDAMFYAHLYLGLYFDVLGDRGRALEHLRKATGEFATEQYMGDVARVHLRVIEAR